MLARVLGGEVFRGEVSEIGWLPVRSSDPELVPEGPWFQWHFDSFTVPPGATVIAETDVGPQAFVAGRSLGLQFHPEVTTQIMDDWVRAYRHELDADGVDPDALLEETKRLADESRARALQLFERFLHDVAQLDVLCTSHATRRPAGGLSAMTATGIASNDTHVFPRFLDLDVPEHRTRRRRLAHHDRRPPDPGCVLGRRDGRVPRPRGAGDRRRPPPIKPNASRTSTTTTSRASRRNDWPIALLEVVAPGMARVRLVSGRLGGERDGAAARPAVPRRARRHRALARDLAGAVVPRVDDGDARAERPARAPGAVHPLPGVAPPHPALDVALRPDAARRRWRSSTGYSRRPDRETVAAFFCEPVSAAALPGASPPDRFWKGLEERRERARVPDLFRRGRDRDRPRGDLAGGGSAADRARHRRDREGPRRRLRAARSGALPGSTSTTRSIAGRASSTSGTRGTGRRCPRPSASAVLDLLVERGLVDRVRDRGPGLRDELEAALEGSEIVREVRGRGFLLGVELVDPAGRRVVPPGRARRRVARRRHGPRARAPRHVDPSTGRRLRRGPDAPRARVREHRRGARGDRRSLPGHDRVGGAVDQGLPADGHGMSDAGGSAARSSCSSRSPT